MNPLDSYIQEGILKRTSSVKQAGNEARLDLLKEYAFDRWSPGSYARDASVFNPKHFVTVSVLRDGTLQIFNQKDGYDDRVKLMIGNIDSAKAPEFLIGACNVPIDIMWCKGLSTLEGMFAKNADIYTNIEISGCPKLNSVKGIPNTIRGEFKWILSRQNNIRITKQNLKKFVGELPTHVSRIELYIDKSQIDWDDTWGTFIGHFENHTNRISKVESIIRKAIYDHLDGISRAKRYPGIVPSTGELLPNSNDERTNIYVLIS